MLETRLQDLRYAWRHIRRSPGFALAAILILALGIGATTAMFSMLNALTMQRLPIADPDGLIAIAPRTSRGLPRSTPVAAVDELSRNGPLDNVCGYLGGVVLPVLANEQPVQTLTTFVTGQCFAAFGVTPALGRAITDADAPIYSPGARVALISHRLWTARFNGEPSVLGRAIQVNNVEVTIIGVLPQGFLGLEIDHGVDIFTTFDSVLPAGPVRRQLASFILGRLHPGRSLEQASAELATRWPALIDAVVPAALPPSEFQQLRDSTPTLERFATGTSRNRERYAQPLTIILGLTSLLLLLACVNLGALLLARVNARSPEIGVRLALGGTRLRIAQQLLIESLVLSLSGTAVGVPLAYALAVTLPAFMPPVNVPYAMSFAPDLRVLAVSSLIGIAVGVLMSALPIAVAMRRPAGLQFTWDRTVVGAPSRWGRGLVVAQVALSVMLLVGAVLLTRSLYLLQTTDLGIRTADILNVKLFTLPNAGYNRGDRASYYPPLMERISALPGVRSAAFSSSFPRVTSASAGMPITFVGQEPAGVQTSSDYVSPKFFQTMGIPLLAGRGLSWSDTLLTTPVAVVSESLARALSVEGSVLERRVRIRTLPVDQEMMIVGVVGDATQGDPRKAHALVIYRPALQIPAISAFNPNLLIETSDPATVVSGVRRILRDGGRDYAQEIIRLDDLLARAPATERMSATVAAAVGGLAVLLAFIGVHGALAYSVSRRRREIGVRVAVGATSAMVARGIVGEGLRLTLAGVALGLPLAFAGARSLKALMYGISESDPVTFGGAAVFFLALGTLAGLAPARRAARLDPVAALRAE
ncbi:MAG: ADOP family duplicated permease [Vicinamibacterales bacterium]